MNEHMDETSRPTEDDLRIDVATGDAPRENRADLRATSEEEKLAASLHAAIAPKKTINPDLAARLIAEGEGIVGARSSAPNMRVAPRPGPWIVGSALAAGLLVAIIAAIMFAQRATLSSDELAAAEERLQELQERVASNDQILADARSRVSELEGTLAATSEREVQLAEQLALATSDLEAAQLAIARYEQPVDPELLADNRRLLLEVPETIRVAWSPFDLPDAPAEQRNVTGDVVWNDDLQQGYLRFVGLKPNDPAVEQYQVWVIDDRGMEQKVSGGVFNATAEGEVIVPIHPGIVVGRVALFAITIEEPGGTWVPDLRRRVVVAPRSDS